MATSLITGSASEAGLDEERLSLIRERAASWVDGKKTRALVLLGARRGVVALHEAWGTRKPGDDAELISVDTLFHMASMTKPVTATAVMMLTERGLLGINRPVKDYIPELRATSINKILIRHLLTHTSGYSETICEAAFERHVAEHFENLAMPEPEETEHRITRRGLHARNIETLAFEPGKQMEYCNYNYQLLAELVRRVSGRSFKDFVEQEILAPLGMSNSRMGISEDELQRIALREEGKIGAFFDEEWGRAPWGHMGLRSTAWDIAILAQTFLNGGAYNGFRLLSPAYVQAMTTNQIPGIATDFLGWHDEASWSLGWRIQGSDRWPNYDGILRSNGSFDHGGFGCGQVWADPPRDIVGAYLSVCLDIDVTAGVHNWEADIFQDLLSSACF